MASDTFTFLHPRWPRLHHEATQAEAAYHLAPLATAVRLRRLVELIVAEVIGARGLPDLERADLNDRLRALDRAKALPPRLLSKLQVLRKAGNDAAHPGAAASEVTQAQAGTLLRDAWSASLWFCQMLSPRDVPPDPAFALPDVAAGLAPIPVEEEPSNGAPEAPSGRISIDREEAERLRRDADAAFARLPPEARELRTHLRLRDMFTDPPLTQGQAAAVAALEAFFDDPEARVFLLRGHAGTGKTFIIRGLAEWFRVQGRTFALAAPTGRAAKVIAEKAGADAVTLHRLVYDYDRMEEYTEDGLDGSETFKTYARVRINDAPANCAYIVDEASLVSDVYDEGEFFRSGSGYLLKDVLEHVGLDHNDHDKRIVLIGDTAQLPPVGMATSPALDPAYLRRTYGLACRVHDLEEVVRQKAESGILRNVAPLREGLKTSTFNRLAFDFSSPDVEAIGTAEVVPRYLEACGHAVNDRAMIVTRSNAEAAAYNYAIREHLFPGRPHVVAGDKLMVVANNATHEAFIANGDFAWVRQADAEVATKHITLRRKHPDTGVVEEVEVALAFRDMELVLRKPDGTPYSVTTKVLDTLLHDTAPNLGSDAHKALYVDFVRRHPGIRKDRHLRRQALRADPWFNALRAKFGYAVTCHKAQGSEWDRVIVVCPGGSKGEQLSAQSFRWFYTAMTRAKGTLTLVDPPCIDPLDVFKRPPEPERQSPEVDDTGSVPPGAGDAPEGLATSILRAVEARLEGSGIGVADVLHHQFQEALYLNRGSETARVNLAYDGKGRITAVTPVGTDALAVEAGRLLRPLVGMSPGDGRRTGNAEPPAFSRPELRELDSHLRSSAGARGIRVVAVTEGSWSVRYVFARDGQVTVDIFWNSRRAFTKCNPVNPMQAPPNLLSEVLDLIGLRR